MTSYWTNWRSIRADITDYDDIFRSKEVDASMDDIESNVSFDEGDAFDFEPLDNFSSDTSEGEDFVSVCADCVSGLQTIS